eukprot:TRINITY_DN7777_c0_g1_i1.p1 TRINITY_DN7777_c0_g1~~TRINITY_DN7777_c0_g1_i1.p1  ORF type:complete len:242 (+),score=53.73 TRINITY_DN7777_c0_g1_i1:48-728(+)
MTVSENNIESEITLVDGKLGAVCCGMTSLTEIPKQKEEITNLDVSDNELKDLSGLENFPDLTTLILDNNEIAAFTGMPLIKKLETLWVNKNSINDLNGLLDILSVKAPVLQYLSLLGNSVCKNDLVGSSKEESQRYRLYVIHKIPSLRFLDSLPVTDEERQSAKQRGAFLKVEKAVSGDDVSKSENTFYKDAPSREGQHATFLGFQKHYYSGKSSEGNRFIKDDQL